MARWLKVLVVFAAMVGGLPSVAWAHNGHEHGVAGGDTVVGPVDPAVDAERALACGQWVTQAPAVSRTTVSPLQAPVDRGKNDRDGCVADVSADLVTTPANPLQPFHQGNCCCGSIACHVGVDALALGVPHRYRFSERVELPPVLAMVGAIRGGIERPPRMSIPL